MSRARLLESELVGAAGFLESGTDGRFMREDPSKREEMPEAFVQWLLTADVRVDGGIAARRDILPMC
jgi:hypothetical protein